MTKKIFGLLIALAMGSSASFARDCGEVPIQTPSVPSGENANSDEIRNARQAIIAYSNRVDEYLACMDARAPNILPYMTKEQKSRWEEDLADLHERRRDVQTQMNSAIRAFRRAASRS